MRSYENCNKDLRVKEMMCILKKLIRLRKAVMIIKDCKLLIELHHILMDTKKSMENRFFKQSKYK